MILLKPIITEKSLIKAAIGWYTFMVDSKAVKKMIARAIESKYKVNIIEVRTISMHGKTRRVGKKLRQVRKADWKKAVVKLKSGQKIDAFAAPSGEGK